MCISLRLSKWLRWLLDGRPEWHAFISGNFDPHPPIAEVLLTFLELLQYVSEGQYKPFDYLCLHSHRKVAGSSTGIVFAMYNIGSLAAVFLTGPVNDMFGRRAGMFTGSFIVIIGTCVQATSTGRGAFLGGRFILGFGVSFCCVSAPCYVSEMAHPTWRGTLTGLYNCTW